ncbi:MAG TPA: HD domain-containing phosphohydrolase [Blastocatellia bacterium]|nr:HD domain-containing phosphohydrolase [Blastocatellia bacterium]
MAREGLNRKARVYQTAVTAAGIALWLASIVHLFGSYTVADQSLVVLLVPLIVVAGSFLHHFRLPSGLSFGRNTLVFTPVDAIVLLVACLHGVSPAIFVAAIEGFTSSRRTVRKLASNLFSFSMMAITAAAASASLNAVLGYGFKEARGTSEQTFLAVAVSMLVASLVQLATNYALLSTLFALRQGNSVRSHWRDFLWTMPMFMPNSTAASLLYLAFQYNAMVMIVIGGPIILTIYLAHRQYRDSVQKRISVMEKAHRETIEALAVAINAKDEVTHGHVLRVQIYAAGVARLLGCTQEEVEALKAGALLHDIGKIAVPDYILNKPGKLTQAEFEKMKIHPIAGAQILSRVEFPYPIVPVVRHHHERWDGGGYPDGLKGEAIPLTARIISVVDCFDAVREDRQYRKGMSREEAIDLIMGGSGTMYDPNVVGTFITNLPQFEAEIAAYRDVPVPTFGIEPTEELSETARRVTPAAGLAEEREPRKTGPLAVLQDQLMSLSGLAQVMIGCRTPEEAVVAFAEKLKAIAPYDLCAITLVAPAAGDNVVVHSAGYHWALLKGRTIALGEGVTGWVIANRQPFCNTDPKLDLPPQFAEHFDGYRTLAAFPIIKDKDMHGAVTLYSAKLDEYTAEHQRALQEATALLASVLSSISNAEKKNRVDIELGSLEMDVLSTEAELAR